MLLFIIGLSITIVSVVLLLNTLNVLFLLMFAIGMCITIISAFQPLSGWGTPVTMQEYELLPIISDTNIYVIKDKNGNIMYKYTKQGTEIIESQCYVCTMLKELEEPQKPVLKKSKVNPKRTLWSFPILSCKYVDVLCVPKDGIVK